MERTKLKASCPVCGRNLFRGTENSCIQGNCPKCGANLIINFYNNCVSATVDKTSDGEKNILTNQK